MYHVLRMSNFHGYFHSWGFVDSCHQFRLCWGKALCKFLRRITYMKAFAPALSSDEPGRIWKRCSVGHKLEYVHKVWIGQHCTSRSFSDKLTIKVNFSFAVPKNTGDALRYCPRYCILCSHTQAHQAYWCLPQCIYFPALPLTHSCIIYRWNSECC